MNNSLTLNQITLPATLQQHFDAEQQKTLSMRSGIGQGLSLPRLSVKGKNFSIRSGGQEQVIPSYTIQVIIVDARKNVSKLLYNKAFDPKAQAGSPDCASVDGIKPDFTPAIVDKETGKCPNNCSRCYFNQFGTALQGKGKACKDYKRLIIMFAGTEENPFDPSRPALTFDLPATSFRAPAKSGATMFSEFVQTCERNKLPVSGVVVELGFLPGVAFSQVTMKPVRVVTEEEYNRVLELRETDEVKNALTVKYTGSSDNSEDTEGAINWVPETKSPAVSQEEKTEQPVFEGTIPAHQKDAVIQPTPEDVSESEAEALKELEAIIGNV